MDRKWRKNAFLQYIKSLTTRKMKIKTLALFSEGRLLHLVPSNFSAVLFEIRHYWISNWFLLYDSNSKFFWYTLALALSLFLFLFSRNLPGSNLRQPRGLMFTQTQHCSASDDDEVVDADRASLVTRAGQGFLNTPLLRTSIVGLNLENIFFFYYFLFSLTTGVVISVIKDWINHLEDQAKCVGLTRKRIPTKVKNEVKIWQVT